MQSRGGCMVDLLPLKRQFLMASMYACILHKGRCMVDRSF